MCSLILEVGYANNNWGWAKKTIRELTLACHRQQNKAALFLDICCYKALNEADIVSASSAAALTGDKSCVCLLENEINKERYFEHSTRKIAEREVCNVWTTNLQCNAVLRKAELGIVVEFVFQEIFYWFSGVQNSELSPSDSIFNLRFVTNYVAKLLVTSLAQRLTGRIYNEAEWNDTLPGTRVIG